MALITAAAMVIGFGISVPATGISSHSRPFAASDHFGIRLDIIFGVYMIFLAGTIIHYGLRAWRLSAGDSLSRLEREESL